MAMTVTVVLFYPLLCFQSYPVFTLTQRKNDIFACCLDTITVIRWPKRNCKRRKGRKRDRKCWQRMKIPQKWVWCEIVAVIKVYITHITRVSVCSYGRATLIVAFYLGSTKNRTEFLLDPAEKTPWPVTAPLLLQVKLTFFMDYLLFQRKCRKFILFQTANILVQIHQVCRPFNN